jgi:hypothetical protein
VATDLPIACSLTAAELPERLAEIGAIGREGLLGADIDGAVALLRFRGGGDTRARLERIVAAEAQCCAFLAMGLRDDRDAIELRIEAPPGAEPVVRELVAAFGA